VVGHGEPETEVDAIVFEDELQPEVADVTYLSSPGWNETTEAKYAERYTYVEKLLKIAHGLHYIGIGILAVFVVQVCNNDLGRSKIRKLGPDVQNFLRFSYVLPKIFLRFS